MNDVLLIGKAEAGKLEFNPTLLNLTQFCNQLVEELQLNTKIHTIVFYPQEKCIKACIDEKLLRHILNNLISNAIKYSPQGDTIKLEIICKQKEVNLRIQDQGIGIPVAEQAKLFDFFHRASNVGTIPGTGLGLAIVKKAVDLHSGTIIVESFIEVGTTFTITLPLNQAVNSSECLQ